MKYRHGMLMAFGGSSVARPAQLKAPSKIPLIDLMIGRRTFVGGLAFGVVAAPSMVAAQQGARVWRIGFLSSWSRQSLIESGNHDAFIQGMRDLGYVEGKNLVIEGRFADGQYERLPALAADLVRLKVDLIVAAPSPAIRAAQQATATIPIVFPSTGDPVGAGFAASLARPGGNLTGLSNLNLDVSAKLLELLKTMVPTMSRVAILANPGSSTESAMLQSMAQAAQKLGLQLLVVEARTEQEIDGGFATMARQRVDAMVIAADGFLNMQRRQIADLAIKYHLPSVTQSSKYPRAGGLMSYGQADNIYRRAASYVDKILRGANPGELPIEQPTRFELIINMKTAKALGITIPQSMLLRVDEVIE